MNIKRRIEIGKTPADLWPWLTETERIQRWNTDVVSDEPTTPGPAAVGMRTHMKVREGSRVVDYETVLTVYDPEKAVALEMRGGSLGANPMLVSYLLRPVGQGSELIFTSAWQPQGILLRLMSPLIGVMARSKIRGTLSRLKQLAET